MDRQLTVEPVQAEHIAVNSPCVRNCCLDEKKVCMGCGRSLPEILEWHHADFPRQKEITETAKQRLYHQA